MSKLDSSDLLANPIDQFAAWFAEAEQIASLQFSNAACLSTVDPEGFPDGRIVLLKGFDARGFEFYTNSNSLKGQSLSTTPAAAMTFYWDGLGRQIRIKGEVEMLSAEEADEYFASRPRDSQLGAWASKQSSRLESRELLEARVREFAQKFDGKQVPRPPHWNGYRIKPKRMEFWQLGEHRLHDRFEYLSDTTGAWHRERLYP
jgi:pyridoxamine 5'-phosphate oxidase